MRLRWLSLYAIAWMVNLVLFSRHYGEMVSLFYAMLCIFFGLLIATEIDRRKNHG